MGQKMPAVPEREAVHRAEPPANAATAATLRHGSVRPSEAARSAAATPRVTDIPPPPDEPQSSRLKLPGALLATTVVLLAYVGAIGFFQFVIPNAPSLIAQVGGGVAVAIVVFFFHAFLGGSFVEHTLRAEEAYRAGLRFIALVAPSIVRWIIYACLFGMFIVAFYDLAGWNAEPVARLRVLGAVAMPAILATCAALLVERRFARGEFSLEITYPPTMPLRDRTDWKFKLDRTWSYEAGLMRESVQRMGRHAAIFGFLGSAILIACAVILLRYAKDEDELRHLVALSVGAATTVSFTLNLGQVLFRSASNDSTARMMAWSARTLLIVSVATAFFSVAFLSGSGDSSDGKGYLFQGYKGALIVGVAVALLGERILRAVKDRAATLLGVGNAAVARTGDMTLIDGLSDEDIARLAEEGIDSTHALAYCPTPRLFFNTPYGLQRLCDWQDQALLIARVGRTNAQLLREQYMIRGAVAARQLAREICTREGGGTQRTPDPPSEKLAAMPSEEGEDEVAKLRALAKAMGFIGVNQAVLGLRSLVDDEAIERLELFSRAVPIWHRGGVMEVPPRGTNVAGA
ncbi:MAG: hypothetical protein IPM54_38220 [Polyangiaceae bacterium]|nr:hypothetical protein [Polyangiaceae bacterium]